MYIKYYNKDYDKLKDENDNLRYTITLYQKQIELATKRDVNTQNQMKVFNHFLPLFSELKKTLNFKTPEEVITIINKLKNESDSIHSDYEKIKLELANKEEKFINDRRELEVLYYKLA